ncbi:uncharacterized protein LOC121651938 [Tachysurus ichikawai]
MYSKCKERGFHVRKEDIHLILSTLDPLGTEMRRKRRLHRRIKDEGDFDGSFLDKNLVLFCFLGLIQEELDSTKDTWNSHLIRPLRNSLVPHGRPDFMYTLPELYEIEDYISQVPVEDCDTCEDQCTVSIALTSHVIRTFSPCVHIMAQHQLPIPKERFTALNLYLALRQELTTVLNIVR